MKLHETLRARQKDYIGRRCQWDTMIFDVTDYRDVNRVFRNKLLRAAYFMNCKDPNSNDFFGNRSSLVGLGANLIILFLG